jgi:AbiV family abortive infection protein
MLPYMASKSETFSKSIRACAENGSNLLEDAKSLFDRGHYLGRFSTAFALSVLAQEEFAKAFLLCLVADDAIPWLPEVRRSIARHECKHLLAIVMEWLPPFDADTFKEGMRRHNEWMAWVARQSERYKQGNIRPDPDDPEPPRRKAVSLPADVAAALNIYRHEEIERLRSDGHPWVDMDWTTGKVRKIADGSLDRKKQSAFYVNVTKTGELGLHPGLITREEASEAIKRAEYSSEWWASSDEYSVLLETLPLIFANLIDTSEDTRYVLKG